MYAHRGSMYGSAGGYDLGGVWRPHTGRNELIFDDYPYMYGGYGGYGGYGDFYGPTYNPALIGQYYQSPMDYYGAYNSLAMFEEQLRMMHGLSEAERLARWQARLEFEELCEEERAMRYAMMAEEERMRLGLMDGSYWGCRYGGYGMMAPGLMNGHLSPWTATRLPLSASLSTRFSPRSAYGSMIGSAYGYGAPLAMSRHSLSSNLLTAQADEARRLRRHAREMARQSRGRLLCY